MNRLNRPRPLAKTRATIERLEARQVLSSMLALTAADQIASFDSGRPDLISTPVAISGLQAGETILAIDSRPSTAQVYGLGSTGRIYTLDATTGASTPIGTGPIAAPLSGTQFSMDFDPSSGDLRIVSDGGEDLRVDPETLQVTVDPNLAYDVSDPGSGTTPRIVAAAFNPQGAPPYEIDAARDALVTQGKIPASTLDVNAGRLFTISPLGVDVSGPVGFGFTADFVGLVALKPTPAASTNLYQIPALGQAGPLTLVGSFPSSIAIRDLAPALLAPKVYAVNAANSLIAFASNTPGTLLANHAIQGLQPGETVQSITFRPSTGQLYGFGTSGRLYTIDPNTGAASAVSPSPITPAYDGTKASIEFVPGQQEILLATKAGQALRINPDNGVVDQVYSRLVYTDNDVSVGLAPSVVAQSNASVSFTTFQGVSYNTLDFGIDSARDTLITVSPNGPAGSVATTGTLGRDVTDDAGLDTFADFETLASLTDVGASASAMYRVYPRNNNTAAQGSTPVTVVRIGAIGGGSVVRSIAIAPSGMPQFDPASVTVSEGAGSAVVTVRRVAGSSLPLRAYYRTTDGGTAVAGVDYTPVSGFLDFADGETTKTFSVPIRAGSFADGSRTVAITVAANFSNSLSYPIAAGTITIVAPPAPPPSVTFALEDLAFRGPATAISSLDVGFSPGADPAVAGNAANYVITGTSATHPRQVSTIVVASVFFDPSTRTAHVVFASPFALKTYRSLQVEGRGLGAAGSNAVFGFSVLRGSAVKYTDPDGDRVSLAVAGRNAKIVVVRNGDGNLVSAWVEGRGRSVSGSIAHTRKSNRRTTIVRFVTNGAKLRLPRSFDVRQVPSLG